MLRVNVQKELSDNLSHNEQTGNEDTPLSTVNSHNKEDIWNSIATYITSIYFDSPNTMVMYKDRIARIESAQLFRIRWYGRGGTTIFTGQPPIFLMFFFFSREQEHKSTATI